MGFFSHFFSPHSIYPYRCLPILYIELFGHTWKFVLDIMININICRDIALGFLCLINSDLSSLQFDLDSLALTSTSPISQIFQNLIHFDFNLIHSFVFSLVLSISISLVSSASNGSVLSIFIHFFFSLVHYDFSYVADILNFFSLVNFDFFELISFCL